jgi:hypothetical protein
MSSYAGVYVHGVEVFTWRNEVDPVFLFLFTNHDVHRRPGDPDNEDEFGEVIRLTAPVSVLRDRLAVLGLGREVLENAFSELNGYSLKHQRLILAYAHNRDRLEAEIEFLESLTLQVWTELLTQAIVTARDGGRNDRTDPKSVASLLDMWKDADPRLLLGAVLLACADDAEVTLDVSELVEGGWVDDDFDPQTVAIEHFSYSLANGSPPVVITEGSSDARFLQAAVQIRYPHLKSYIKFFDFGDGAAGSASAGVQTLKSFAAAGISNRVVLLLDNDTAARDALRALRGTTLPSHYSVVQYPAIDLAHSYPTLGPGGLSDMDVNGLAGSIELYLGVDVLTRPDGTLSPVQWRSYSEGTKAYQGEVLNKTDVQKRFRGKVKAAETDPDLVGSQDWSGLDAIISSLIELLRMPLNRTD